jgi:hypothetical protein
VGAFQLDALADRYWLTALDEFWTKVDASA